MCRPDDCTQIGRYVTRLGSRQFGCIHSLTKYVLHATPCHAISSPHTPPTPTRLRNPHPHPQTLTNSRSPPETATPESRLRTRKPIHHPHFLRQRPLQLPSAHLLHPRKLSFWCAVRPHSTVVEFRGEDGGFEEAVGEEGEDGGGSLTHGELKDAGADEVVVQVVYFG